MKEHVFENENPKGRKCFHTVKGRVCGRVRSDKTHEVDVQEDIHAVVATSLGLSRERGKAAVFGMAYGKEPLTAYEGGATRTPKTERRELIPSAAIDALARRLALGAKKHGVNNWRKGGPEFVQATVNHLLDHIFAYLEHGGKENTDAIICNAAFLCHYEEKTPYEGVVEG